MLKISNDMEEIMQQDHAVVYFTANWCNPCKQLKPHYAKAAVIDADTSYYMVDVDEVGSEYLTKYSIQSIPQIFEMNNGEISKKIMGRTSDDILTEMGKTNAA
jgi:thioredoxin-like negative regulator of GroEL